MKLDEAFILALFLTVLLVLPVGWVVILIKEQFTQEQIVTGVVWVVTIAAGLMAVASAFEMLRTKKTVS